MAQHSESCTSAGDEFCDCCRWPRTCAFLVTLLGLYGGVAVVQFVSPPPPPSATPREIFCGMAQNVSMEATRWERSPMSTPIMTQRHTTCSVISNSGVLQRYQHGKDIDSTSLVVRFNDAPVTGFEQKVGSRDDLRFMNDLFGPAELNGKMKVDLHNTTTYISFPNKEPQVEGMETLHAKHPSVPLFWGDMGLQQNLSAYLRQSYPSDWFPPVLTQDYGTAEQHWFVTTGAVGMFMAMSICDEVHAYAMASTWVDSNYPFHYYDSTLTPQYWRADTNIWHRTFDAEKDLWKRLSVNGIREIEATSLAIIPGFSGVDCANVTDDPWQRLPPEPSGLWIAISSAGLFPVALCCVIVTKLWATYERRGSGASAGTLTAVFAQQPMQQNSAPGVVAKRKQLVANLALVPYVALLCAMDITANATAQAHHKSYPWNPLAVVLLTEVCKMLASTALCMCERRPVDGLPDCSSRPFLAHDHFQSNDQMEAAIVKGEPLLSTRELLWRAFYGLSTVATLHAFNNVLNLFILSKGKLDSYVVWRNSTIVFNALLWVQCRGKRLHLYQWVAVAGFFIGCCVNTVQVDGTWKPPNMVVCLMMLYAFTSSLVSVANDHALKAGDLKSLGIHRLNQILYGTTAAILLCVFLADCLANGESVFVALAALDSVAFTLVGVQTILGLVVSLVLLHADTMAKTMAGGVREVLTLLIAPYFVVSRIDWICICSVIWVLFSIVLYFMPHQGRKIT